MKPRFEIFKGRDGQFYFRLRASNGKTLCESEGYLEKSSCVNGINSLRKNAVSAGTFITTDEGGKEL